ncbi:MAG TPA: DUF308 domain-containing protein [Bacteroidales bacterium]|nr:DUF308 domain-containing protein [Bacteroidales bacterium]HPE57045.1 DUF308 domain-containing protein [Bacteroidales bacterium]HRX96739.1 DUF308 domain-containing protein [Bacteroidales bacterium]
MEEQAIPIWYMPLIKGIVMILLSILILASPEGALIAWAFYIGIGFVITGMVLIYQGFAGRETEENWTWKIFEGLLDMFIGFMLMVNPLVTASIIPFLFGLWGAFYGIALFIDAFAHKENQFVKFAASLLVFWISTFIMFNPLLFGISIAIWVGVVMLIMGLYSLVLAFHLKKSVVEIAEHDTDFDPE